MRVLVIFKVIVLLVITILTGCGIEVRETESEEKKEEKALETPPQPVQKPLVAKAEDVMLRGYIASAFEVEVDGDQYTDSEDFYTRQLARLEGEAIEAGYEGYEVRFNAEIGLSDLKAGMRVFLAPVDSRGYGGETSIQSNGSFQFYIPADGSSQEYKIRSNKRVDVTLTSADKKTVVKWCYNFSGIDMQVSLNDSRPVVINRFVTQVTRYACSTQSSGIQIPIKTPAAAEPTDSEQPEQETSESSEIR